MCLLTLGSNKLMTTSRVARLSATCMRLSRFLYGSWMHAVLISAAEFVLISARIIIRSRVIDSALANQNLVD